MQTIYLDISNKGVIPAIYAKQGDVSRKFQVVLTDSGLPYVPANGFVFSVWYSGASGEGNYTDIGDKSAFSVNGNKISVELITQMLSAAGEGLLCLVLNGADGSQIASWNISYVVEPIPGATSDQANAYYTAFSRAVENLPYPDVSLSVQGKAADAAATGQALNGKAPAGYVAETYTVTSDEAFENTIENVYAAMSDNSVRYITITNSSGSQFDGRWVVTINRTDSAHGSAKAQSYADTIVKALFNVWYPFEWVNPPMNIGVEYRTTERFKGNAVYTKLINFGALPNNTYKDVDIVVSASGNAELVDARFAIRFTNGEGFRIIEFDNYCGISETLSPAIKAYAGVYGNTSGSYNARIITTADMTAYTATITAKYTRG